jgi:hypothetical protein
LIEDGAEPLVIYKSKRIIPLATTINHGHLVPRVSEKFLVFHVFKGPGDVLPGPK